MNFLQLAQRARERCGIPGTGPSAVTNQVGEYLQLIHWINEAWMELQQAQREWNFMKANFTLPITAAGGSIYLATAASVTDLNRWRTDTLRSYSTAVGVSDEGFLAEWDYDTFRDTFMFGQQTPGRPVVFAVRPEDQALVFGPAPDRNYTVTGRYMRRATELALPDESPRLPDEYHMLIVYGAMRRYAATENAPEIYFAQKEDSTIMMNRLLFNQLPDIESGDALA